MAGWHHRLNGRGFEQALGVGDGQGGLACCSSRGRKESDRTEQLNTYHPELEGAVLRTCVKAAEVEMNQEIQNAGEQ